MNKRGFSLIEMIIYSSLTALIILAAVTTFLAMSQSYRRLQSGRSIDNAALVGLERLARETRSATSVTACANGDLKLNTLDDAGNPLTLEFFTSGSSLHLKAAEIDQGSLTPALVTMTRFTCSLLTSLHSNAVKVEFTFQSGSGSSLTTKNFSTTVVVRGSYSS